MAEDDTRCYPTMVDADADYFPLSDDSKWQDLVSATSSSDCQHTCDDNTACIMYRYSTNPADNKCQLLLEDPAGGQVIGLKAAGGMDYVLYRVDSELTVGALLGDVGAKTPEECLKSCHAGTASGCELVSLSAASLPDQPGPCVLYKSVMDADWIGMHHVQGNKLFLDGIVRPRVDGKAVVGEAEV